MITLTNQPPKVDLALAFAVTSDGNIDQLGDGDDGDLSVQNNAKRGLLDCFTQNRGKTDGTTYSEAMLISGASKQISCVILFSM